MSSEMKYTDAHDEKILIHGRTDMSQNPIPIFWTGAGAEFITDSSNVELIMETDYEEREQWIRVTMDSATIIRMPLPKGRQSIAIYQGILNLENFWQTYLLNIFKGGVTAL